MDFDLVYYIIFINQENGPKRKKGTSRFGLGWEHPAYDDIPRECFEWIDLVEWKGAHGEIE